MLNLSIRFFTILLFGMSLGNSISIDDLERINSHKYFSSKTQEFLKNDNKLSPICALSLGAYASGLATFQEWALKMFDAGSKIPSGILEGNVFDLGTFDECLNIEGFVNNTIKISGRYCLGAFMLGLGQRQFTQNETNLVQTRITNANVRDGPDLSALTLILSTCMPDTCSPQDIQEFYFGLNIPMAIPEDLCQTKSEQPELDNGAIATLAVFGVVLCIIIVSTAYDIYLYYTERKPNSPLTTAFSLLTNGREILNTKSAGQINCMHGIRVITTMWIVTGHRYLVTSWLPTKNPLAFSEWITAESSMFLMSVSLSVDSFLVMGGAVLAFTFLNSAQKGVKFNIIMYYVHRYLRLTPALAVVMVIHLTLLKYMGSGPMWPSIARPLTAFCEESWWKLLLYIQNYGNMGTTCVHQSWYLSTDMQLFLVSPFILVPLTKFPKWAVLLTICLTIGSVVAAFATMWTHDINTFLLANEQQNGTLGIYMDVYHTATHLRASSWLIGILFGYVIFKIKQKQARIVINKGIILLLWTITLAVLATCVFTGNNLVRDMSDRLGHSFYAALVRPVWSIGVGFIILASVLGYGGPIDWFLSMPIFRVLSKLNYSLYLTHFVSIYLASATMRVPLWFSNGEYFHIVWGDFAYTFISALALTLAFEFPLATVEKVLLGGGKRKPKPKKEEQSQSHNGQP